MRIKLLCAIAALVLLSVWTARDGVRAEDPPASMGEFLRLSGMFELAEQQQALEIAAMRVQLKQSVRAMAAQMNVTDPRFLAQTDSLSMDISNALENAYTTDELMAAYSAPFDREYTAQELSAMIAELSTPEGLKMMRTANEAATAVYAFRSARQTAAIQQAMATAGERFRRMMLSD